MDGAAGGGYPRLVIEFPSGAEAQRDLLRRERAERGEPALPEEREWAVAAWRLEVAGHHAAAAEAWRRALSARAGMPQALLGLGRALLDGGDPDGAVEAFRAAAAANRDAADRGLEPLLPDPDEEPAYGIGLAEHARGRHEAALAAYAECVERHPYFPEPLLEMARCHLALGRPEEAARCCRLATERAPQRPGFREDAEALLRACAGPPNSNASFRE